MGGRTGGSPGRQACRKVGSPSSTGSSSQVPGAPNLHAGSPGGRGEPSDASRASRVPSPAGPRFGFPPASAGAAHRRSRPQVRASAIGERPIPDILLGGGPRRWSRIYWRRRAVGGRLWGLPKMPSPVAGEPEFCGRAEASGYKRSRKPEAGLGSRHRAGLGGPPHYLLAGPPAAAARRPYAAIAPHRHCTGGSTRVAPKKSSCLDRSGGSVGPVQLPRRSAPAPGPYGHTCMSQPRCPHSHTTTPVLRRTGRQEAPQSPPRTAAPSLFFAACSNPPPLPHSLQPPALARPPARPCRPPAAHQGARRAGARMAPTTPAGGWLGPAQLPRRSAGVARATPACLNLVLTHRHISTRRSDGGRRAPRARP
jgi:hypothetical protein